MTTIYTTISTKGGVGKTTTLLGLAMTLSQRGNRVMLIDSDPNEPMTRFKETGLNNEYWDDKVDTTSVISGDGLNKTIDVIVSELEEEGYDYILIDTKGGEGDFVGYVAQLSDAIIVPTGLTSVDIDGAEATLIWFQQLKDSGIELPPIRVLITAMPTKSKMNKSHEHNLEVVGDNFPMAKTVIPQHAHIQNMSLYGLFHKVAEQCRASKDPTDKIQARQFDIALKAFDELADELQLLSVQEAAA